MTAQAEATGFKAQHPPRARLVVRVGITGHRPESLPPDAPARLLADMSLICSQIFDLAAAIGAENTDLFSSDLPEMSLATSLAEGVDRLAADAALDRGYQLVCVLPFSREEYARDFKTVDSREQFAGYLRQARAVFELDGVRSEEAEAYEAASQIMIANSDLIIAVWDGQPSGGIGGTADTIHRALRVGRPVIWLSAGNSGPKLLPRSLAIKDFDHLDISARAEPLEPAALREIMFRSFAPPHHKGEGIESDARVRLKRFLGEKERRWNFALAYPLLGVLGGRRPRLTDVRPMPYGPAVENEWSDYWQALDAMGAGAYASTVRRILAPRYAFADKLSVYFAQVYRSSYVVNFALGAAAVCLALLSVFGPLHRFEAYFSLTELCVIGAILLNTYWGKRAQWHDKWLDYRQIAEELRHMRILTLTGGMISLDKLDARNSQEKESGTDWANWYLRATERELGLPSLWVDAAYVANVKTLIRQTEIEAQRDWYFRNAATMKRLSRTLEIIGVAAFILTAAMSTFYLITAQPILQTAIEASTSRAFVDHFNEIVSQFSLFCSAFLPAVGAAIAGIRVQGDFGGVAQRSAVMAERMNDVANALKADGALDIRYLSSVVKVATDTMLIDISDWRSIFRDKSLNLPV